MSYDYRIKNGECELFKNGKVVMSDDSETVNAYIVDLESCCEDDILEALIIEFQARD